MHCERLRFKRDDGLALQFESTKNIEFAEDYPLRPVATINRFESSESYYKNALRDLNSDTTDGYAIYLREPKHEKRLYEILVMRRVLEMNPEILNNISLFQVGLEILFPSPNSLRNDIHVIDNEIAKYFTRDLKVIINRVKSIPPHPSGKNIHFISELNC